MIYDQDANNGNSATPQKHEIEESTSSYSTTPQKKTLPAGLNY